MAIATIWKTWVVKVHRRMGSLPGTSDTVDRDSGKTIKPYKTRDAVVPFCRNRSLVPSCMPTTTQTKNTK